MQQRAVPLERLRRVAAAEPKVAPQQVVGLATQAAQGKRARRAARELAVPQAKRAAVPGVWALAVRVAVLDKRVVMKVAPQDNPAVAMAARVAKREALGAATVARVAKRVTLGRVAKRAEVLEGKVQVDPLAAQGLRVRVARRAPALATILRAHSATARRS